MRLLPLILLSTACTAQAVILRLDGDIGTDVGTDIGTDSETGMETDTATEPPPVDADNDGYVGADDCDDQDPEINPGARELCDEIDHDCDGDVFGDACPCPVESTELGLFALCPQRVTFDEAAATCDDAGMNLTFPVDEAIDELLGEFAQSMRQDIWLGFTDREREGRWIGVNGETTRYENWERNQPDNWQNGEDCAQLRVWTGGWNDVACSSNYAFVCRSR